MQHFQEILKTQQHYSHLLKQHFFQVELFTFQWWILVATTFALWGLWLIVLDRKNLKSILLVGLFTGTFAFVLDDIGLSTARWAYPYKMVYFTTRLTPVDLVILPVAYMIIYQYCKKWTTYLTFSVLFALFASFIAEPIFVHLHMYIMEKWKYVYSAPIYAIIGIVVRGATDLTHWLEQKAKVEKGS